MSKNSVKDLLDGMRFKTTIALIVKIVPNPTILH